MKTFNKNKYTIIRSVLNEQTATLVKNIFYLKKKILRTHLDKRYIPPFSNDWGTLGDDQSNPETFCLYGDPVSDSLFPILKPLLEKECGYSLNETYSYMRVYSKGCELKKHKDRLSCDVSASLCIEDNIWPLFLEDQRGNTQEINLKKGDMIMYRGCDLKHWREPNPFETHAQVFLHFNSSKTKKIKAVFDGDKTEDYDGRPHLGLPLYYRGII
tara:strand:- start:341 stop:982 length:642 start_codon:yes stop_codon:yes gene_type:complete